MTFKVGPRNEIVKVLNSFIAVFTIFHLPFKQYNLKKKMSVKLARLAYGLIQILHNYVS